MEDPRIELISELVDYAFLVGRQRGQGLVDEDYAKSTSEIIKNALAKLLDIEF